MQKLGGEWLIAHTLRYRLPTLANSNYTQNMLNLNSLNGPPTYPGLKVEDKHGSQVDTPSPSPIHHGSQQIYPGKGMATQRRRSLTSTAWDTPQCWRGGQ